ncbi:hypothetical protein MBLNU230_g3257t2 [Neophaeotheca triangularis]
MSFQPGSPMRGDERGKHQGLDVAEQPVTSSTEYDGYAYRTTMVEPQAPQPQQQGALNRISAAIGSWTPAVMLVTYFIFSIAFYTLLNDYAEKVFWFLLLTIATITAGSTAFEAYDSMSLHSEARKSIAKAEEKDSKTLTIAEELPTLDLIFDNDLDQKLDIQQLRQFLETTTYPREKLRLIVLSTPTNQISPFEGYNSGETLFVNVPHWCSASLGSRLTYAFQASTPATIAAIFTGDQTPHPHAPLYAVSRLVQDAKIKLIQGRRVLAPQSSSLIASLASLEFDFEYATLRPGRTNTWALPVANGSNTYWRSDVLQQAAADIANSFGRGEDLGFAAFSRFANAKNDMSVISYEPCAPGWFAYWRRQVQHAKDSCVATLRWSKLAFMPTGKGNPKRTLLTRLGVVYCLPLQRVGAHAVLQYFSMALSFLFTQAPSSAADLAYLIYFPYTISIWFIVGGLVCILSTLLIAYKNRSEFVSWWSFPLSALLYTPVIVFWSVIDFYAQVGQLVSTLRSPSKTFNLSLQLLTVNV